VHDDDFSNPDHFNYCAAAPHYRHQFVPVYSTRELVTYSVLVCQFCLKQETVDHEAIDAGGEVSE
jgi:hypothetical protein